MEEDVYSNKGFLLLVDGIGHYFKFLIFLELRGSSFAIPLSFGLSWLGSLVMHVFYTVFMR